MFEEADDAGFALHGWTVDASGDFDLAVGVGGLERAEEAFYVAGVGGSGDADIDFDLSVGGDDVGVRAAGDDAAVEGEAAGEVGEGGDGLDEAGDLEVGGVAGLEVDSAMGGDAGDLDEVAADAFAGGL